MGILRHRRLRRQEIAPNDGESDQQEDSQSSNNNNDKDGGDEEGNGDEEEDLSLSTTIPSSISLPSTSTENQFDKAKAIGEEVIKTVPSK